MKIALLSCQNWPGALENERAFAKEFPAQYDVKVEIWNDPSVNWSDYNYLIFRSVWDYNELPDEFDAWLNKLDKLNVRTLNPLSVIKRNQHKFYLRDLENQGIDIIPTVFIPKNTGLDLSFLEKNNWTQAVIKPAISASSYMTSLFSQSEIGKILAEYKKIAIERDLLVQPFMSEIQTMGEVSLLFFNGQFSHSILKKPKADDFRVQSQFGGQYHIYQPDASVIATAKNIVQAFGDSVFYARIDGILKDGKFLLMEVELIEPDLYFNYAPEAKQRYFNALETMIA